MSRNTDGSLTIDIPQADAPGYGSMTFPDYVSQQYHNGNPVEIAFIAGYNETDMRIESAAATGAAYVLAIAQTEAADFDSIETQGVEQYGKAGTQPFFLNNAQQFLHPGEFWEDTVGNTVYYAVRNPNDVAALHANDVTVPAAISDGSNATYPISGYAIMSSPLVEIGSDSGPQVQNVTINDIEFAYSSWVDPSYYGYVPYQDGYFVLNSKSGASDDATMQIPSVRVENATGLTITGNTFDHLGGAGVEIYDKSSYNIIHGNTFSDISGDAIIVDGDPGDTTISGQNGTPLGYYPVNVSKSDAITGNVISTVGATFPDSCAILALKQA